MKKKKLFWAIVSCETENLMWSGVEAINSKYGSGSSHPHIYTSKKEALANAGCDFVIPCEIKL